MKEMKEIRNSNERKKKKKKEIGMKEIKNPKQN